MHVCVFLDGQDAEEQGHRSPLGSAQSTSGQAEEGAHHTEGRRRRRCWRRSAPPLRLHGATTDREAASNHLTDFVILGFDVAKTGDARIGFVGFPSVGKSTLLSNLAGVYSEVAAYEFTTLTTVPGVVRYKGAKIQVQKTLFDPAQTKNDVVTYLSLVFCCQLLDLPGIIEGAKDGKGRGRQVIAGKK